MRRKTITYMIYAISILIITSFLSIQILERRIRVSYSIAKQAGKFTDILMNFGKNWGRMVENKFEKGLLKRVQTLEAISEIFPVEKTKLNLNCPCKEVGEESGCRVGFLIPSDNPAFNLELVPGYEQIFDGFGLCIPYTNVKINSHGFRDYEYPAGKTNNTFRVVVIGDSTTFGQGVELNQSYPKVLETILNEMGSDKNYEVLNFGVPGYNIAEKVEFLRTKAMKFNPDLIIFQYLGDDISDWDEFREIENERLQEFAEEQGGVVKDLIESEKLEIHRKTYQEYLRSLMNERLNESLKKVEKSFEDLNSTQNNIDILLVIDGVSPDQAPTLEKISNSYNWPLLSLKFLKQYPKNKIEIHPKDSHPTAFAHTIIAEKNYGELLSNNLLPIE